MDDQTTITEAPAETGVEQTQPVETEQAEAVQAEVTSDESSNNEPSIDEDTSRWLESKGIDPTSPEAVSKLAKSAREAEKAMHAKAQKASQLEKSMLNQSDNYAEEVAVQTGDSPDVLKRLNRMEVRDAMRNFWDSNPDARQHEDDIAKKIEESGLSGSVESVLKAGYALVLADNKASLKAEGGRQALETLAGKQRAAVPSGSAVSSGVSNAPKITREVMQQKLNAGDAAWFEKNQSEINRLAQEGAL